MQPAADNPGSVAEPDEADLAAGRNRGQEAGQQIGLVVAAGGFGADIPILLHIAPSLAHKPNRTNVSGTTPASV